MTSTPITVYTRPGCPQCTATTTALRRSGLDHVVVDLEQTPEAVDQLRRAGHRHAPVVIAGTQQWSGYRPERIRDLATRR